MKIMTKKKPKKKISKSCNKNSNKLYLNIELDEPTNAKNFNYYFKDSNIFAKYYLKIKKKNINYYECGKKYKGCNGKIRYKKKEKKFLLTQECDPNIEHDSAVFETFYYDFRNDNIKNYNTVTSA